MTIMHHTEQSNQLDVDNFTEDRVLIILYSALSEFNPIYLSSSEISSG